MYVYVLRVFVWANLQVIIMYVRTNLHSIHTVLRPNITNIAITPSPSDNNLLHEFNDTVSLTCTAEGGPRIMTRWQFDDGSSVEIVADGNSSVTYVVSSLSTDHTGVYYCEAIIDGMTDTSMNYTLFGKYTVITPMYVTLYCILSLSAVRVCIVLCVCVCVRACVRACVCVCVCVCTSCTYKSNDQWNE